MIKPTGKNPCPTEDLTLFFYDELKGGDRLRLEKHLQWCAPCRRELARLRSTLEALPKTRLEPSREEIRIFNDRLRERLRPGTRRPLRPVLGWSLAAAAAVLIMMTLHSPAPDPQQPPPEVALRSGAGMEPLRQVPEPELLLNLDLLENMDLLQALEETERSG